MQKLARILFLGLTISIFITAPAFATYIDFTSFAVPTTDNNAGPFYWNTVDGLTISFSAGGEDLWFDSTDGFGVRGQGHEIDEIEHPEAMSVSFDTPVYVTNFCITDLFYEGGNPPTYFEIGWYNFTGSFDPTDSSTYVQFQQDDPDMKLGETLGLYTLAMDQYVETIWFSAPGLLIEGQNHEFSVAGVDVNPIPEPATMLLFGSGLIVVAGLRRKLR